jgi:hypothetical protein
MEYFTYLPKVIYEGSESRNILVKLSLIRDIINQYKVFYPYTIKDGERPDTIAFDYYGSTDFEWLVCLPNNIMDIPSDWPKSYRELYSYLKSSYGDVELTKSTVHHYEYTGVGGDAPHTVRRKDWIMTPKTFASISVEEKAGWTPVYLFDYENRLNEEKRKITLLSNVYITQIEKEIRALLNVK